MRSDPADFQLVSPGSLQAVLSLLTKEPGAWLPIAGGTDVMVLYSAGKLAARKLVSIWNLPELRRIEVLRDEVQIGAGCSYSELLANQTVKNEFPLLAWAARVTGSVANQNRGTLGGNIVNASPAADSLPPLLAYEAELILISARGERRVPYLSFHTGYKQMQLAPDELVRAVALARKFAGYFAYSRKVGARNAQAISKVCIAALGKSAKGVAKDIRIAFGSVAPIPIRLTKTERLLEGPILTAETLSKAREISISEIQPIDDIRSTSRYRAHVAGNLVAEFLQQLREVQSA